MSLGVHTQHITGVFCFTVAGSPWGSPLSTCARVASPPCEPRAAGRDGTPGGPGHVAAHPSFLSHPERRTFPSDRGILSKRSPAFCIEITQDRAPVSLELVKCRQKAELWRFMSVFLTQRRFPFVARSRLESGCQKHGLGRSGSLSLVLPPPPFFIPSQFISGPERHEVAEAVKSDRLAI